MQLEFAGAETTKGIKEAVAKAWELDPLSFRLLAKGECMDEERTLESFLSEALSESLELQLLKFDPLLDLGIFEKSQHKGIDLKDPVSSLKKTSNLPDSNNVFLRHKILEPCFCEFEVIRSRDEISFGVTYDRESTEKISGFSNIGCKNTWIFSKKQSMPVFLFGGQHLSPRGPPWCPGGRHCGGLLRSRESPVRVLLQQKVNWIHRVFGLSFAGEPGKSPLHVLHGGCS